jgi:hypothetical protein
VDPAAYQLEVVGMGVKKVKLNSKRKIYKLKKNSIFYFRSGLKSLKRDCLMRLRWATFGYVGLKKVRSYPLASDQRALAIL